MMGKGNNFAVTIGNNSGFSSIFKKTINATSFLSFFSNLVTETCSRRNGLLSKKQHGLSLVSADKLRSAR
jgi:hypothetical protein